MTTPTRRTPPSCASSGRPCCSPSLRADLLPLCGIGWPHRRHPRRAEPHVVRCLRLQIRQQWVRWNPLGGRCVRGSGDGGGLPVRPLHGDAGLLRGPLEDAPRLAVVDAFLLGSRGRADERAGRGGDPPVRSDARRAAHRTVRLSPDPFLRGDGLRSKLVALPRLPPASGTLRSTSSLRRRLIGVALAFMGTHALRARSVGGALALGTVAGMATIFGGMVGWGAVEFLGRGAPLLSWSGGLISGGP